MAAPAIDDDVRLVLLPGQRNPKLAVGGCDHQVFWFCYGLWGVAAEFSDTRVHHVDFQLPAMTTGPVLMLGEVYVCTEEKQDFCCSFFSFCPFPSKMLLRSDRRNLSSGDQFCLILSL